MDNKVSFIFNFALTDDYLDTKLNLRIKKRENIIFTQCRCIW